MENYKIVFTLKDIVLEISSSNKNWVEEKIDKYVKYFEIVNINSPNTSPNKFDSINKLDNKDLSITGITVNEFYNKYLKSKNVSRPDLATFFIFYLKNYENKNTVSMSDVKSMFQKIGYPSYNTINYSDILNKAKNKALLNQVNNEWSLTITGEDFINSEISINETN